MNTNTLNKIDATTVHEWMKQDKAVLIDVRETDEYIKEHVPEAHLVPLSGFNPEDFPQEHDKIAVFHCKSGGRTEASAGQILATGFKDVYQLDGGLQGWRTAGLPVNVNAKAPISIMRQVQIAAGLLVVLGVVLGAFVNPWFILLSGVVGAGLAQSGITGTCAMATLLSRMPWNKVITGQVGLPTAVNS